MAIHLQEHEDPDVRISKTERALQANMDLIRELLTDYLVAALPDPEQIEKLRLYRAGGGRKLKGGKSAPMPNAVHPGTLRKWITQVRRDGKYGVMPSYSRRGFRATYFSPQEKALMARVINERHLTLQRISIAATLVMWPPLMPRKTASATRKACRIFASPAARRCGFISGNWTGSPSPSPATVAMKRMGPVGQGLEVSHPLERVEMDEWRIDLISLMAEGGLLQLFTPEELDAIGPKNGKGRWWVAVAIGCRTRVAAREHPPHHRHGGMPAHGDGGQGRIRGCCGGSHSLEHIWQTGIPRHRQRLFQVACVHGLLR
ncbi:hypothetical protein [Paenirhodobacter sp.]|uniref:hypothetical protein n=1 Tax=Paenirhodobacter sp. TaxID=1965326 RepID=UPI003B3E12F8